MHGHEYLIHLCDSTIYLICPINLFSFFYGKNAYSLIILDISRRFQCLEEQFLQSINKANLMTLTDPYESPSCSKI